MSVTTHSFCYLCNYLLHIHRFWLMRKWEKDGLEFRITTYDITDEAQRVSMNLVKNLMLEMAKASMKFDNTRYGFHDLPYTYRERQLDAVLLPALSKICQGLVMTELPVIRKIKDEELRQTESSGRADYWCIYKDYSFVIELKHSYDRYGSHRTRQDTIVERWQVMNEQLKNASANFRDFEEKTKGVIRLGLHVITSITSKAANDQTVQQYKDKVKEIQYRLVNDMTGKKPTTRPDMAMCWLVPKRMVENDDGNIPGLWMFAKWFEPIKHKGCKPKNKS